MRRPRVVDPRIVLATCLGLALLAGCGKGEQGSERRGGDLTFERLADTTGLSAGEPVLQSFEAYRMDNGAMRVKGRARLPDGARLQVAVKRAGGSNALAMLRVTLVDGMFDSPPLLGERGPLPRDRYEFEISAMFVPEWQTPEVLRATDYGRALRGPGITRSRMGTPMLWQTLEMTR